MFQRIPAEMRSFAQWLVWRSEDREGQKPTKVPYSPRHGGKASVTNPADWGTFDEAVAAHSGGSFSGIGFVVTNADPYSVIDLDDTHGDQIAQDRQVKIFREFNSYSEISPSGNGLHIWIKGNIPHGRRRSAIEVYSSERYMTMTGNVYHDVPIVERQELLSLLFEQMGGPATQQVYGDDQAQRDTDEVVLERAMQAANGDKFSTLYSGDWSSLYPSQSEADFALVDIIAFYTQNRAQIARIFRASQLGKRDKAARDQYVAYMVNKSFDRQLPDIDVDGWKIKFQSMIEGSAGAAPGGTTPDNPAAQVHLNASPQAAIATIQGAPAASSGSGIQLPPGLIGEVAQFIFDAAPRPVMQIALAGAIGLVAGIAGRAYNVSGTGLNQYVLLLAPTGTGKEAIANGISKLMASIRTSVPASADFIGPGTIRSDAGLLKWLSKAPCVVSTIGEVSLWLKQLSHPQASSHEIGLKKVILDLYNKSGHGNQFDPMAYSDRDKNTLAIAAPSFSLIGESVPETFYGLLDESMISSGLLPRFLTMEYTGIRPSLSKVHKKAHPSFSLIERLSTFAAHCLTIMHNSQCQDVPLDDPAAKLSDTFDEFCDAQINNSKAEVQRQLWNRAHMKALKLAALCAVGINPFHPLITINEMQWASDIIAAEVWDMLGRFERGEVGQAAFGGASENKQMTEVARVIGDYMTLPFDQVKKYSNHFEMHRDGVIPNAYISRRLIAVATFRLDRLGATAAIKRAIQMFLDGDDIREIPKSQTQARYGKSERTYVVTNPATFIRKK